MTDQIVESRQRILDAALALMSEHGVAGTSMRMLATACDLNVATLYHHFPSKSDLLRAVLRERGYLERLRMERPPPEVTRQTGSAVRRLERLVAWLWWASRQEEAVWRLIIGESLRGDAAARAEALALVDGIDEALSHWVAQVVPELGGSADRIGRLVRATLFSLIVEQLALGPDEERARHRIRDLAEAIAPGGRGGGSPPA